MTCMYKLVKSLGNPATNFSLNTIIIEWCFPCPFHYSIELGVTKIAQKDLFLKKNINIIFHFFLIFNSCVIQVTKPCVSKPPGSKPLHLFDDIVWGMINYQSSAGNAANHEASKDKSGDGTLLVMMSLLPSIMCHDPPNWSYLAHSKSRAAREKSRTRLGAWDGTPGRHTMAYYTVLVAAQVLVVAGVTLASRIPNLVSPIKTSAGFFYSQCAWRSPIDLVI